MSELRRNFKDSVFTFLFSDPKYARELYLYLHPEDTDVTEEECRLVTTKNILAIGQYNDLGIQIRDKLILLVEAQSVFSDNLPLRLLIYLAKAYKDYIVENEMSLYSTKAVRIPRAELYVVYTGLEKNLPDTLRLSDLCGGEGSVEATVKILRGGDSSILGQYVSFCQIADEQRKLYGRTSEAIRETIRICQERDILIPFLASRRKEVIDIMELLFSQEEVWEMTRREIARDAREDGLQKGIQEGRLAGHREGRREGRLEGRQEGRREGRLEGRQEGRLEGAANRDRLYSELLKHLEPLGRTGELLAAITDRSKLAALANEFGLQL